MSRPTTKQDLIAAANTNYDKLLNLISTMTETELNTPFHFELDEKKKEAVLDDLKQFFLRLFSKYSAL